MSSTSAWSSPDGFSYRACECCPRTSSAQRGPAHPVCLKHKHKACIESTEGRGYVLLCFSLSHACLGSRCVDAVLVVLGDSCLVFAGGGSKLRLTWHHCFSGFDLYRTCRTCEAFFFCRLFLFRRKRSPLTVVRPDHEHDVFSLLPQLLPLVADVVSGVRDRELSLGSGNAQNRCRNDGTIRSGWTLSGQWLVFEFPAQGVVRHRCDMNPPTLVGAHASSQPLLLVAIFNTRKGFVNLPNLKYG